MSDAVAVAETFLAKKGVVDYHKATIGTCCEISCFDNATIMFALRLKNGRLTVTSTCKKHGDLTGKALHRIRSEARRWSGICPPISMSLP